MGLGVTLIDQRPALVNKDVLTQLELLIAHQVTSPHDRKALEAWIEAHDTADRRKEFLGSLAALERGEAWVWSPAWLDLFERVKIRARRTYDSSATPKPGEVQVAPQAAAEVDLDALQAQLAETIEKARADDPRELKKKISELERQLAKSGNIGEQELLEARVNANLEGRAEAFRSARNLMTGMLAELDRIMPEKAPNLSSEVGKVDQKLKQSRNTKEIPTPRTTQTTSTDRPVSSSDNAAAEGLNAYQLDLLKVLINRSPVPTPRAQLGGLAGRSIRSSAFSPNLRALIDAGLVEKTDRGYVATDAGMRSIPGFEPAPNNGRAALDYWIGRLPRYQSTILSVMAQHAPRALDREQIAQASNYSTRSSAFGPALRDLLDLQFIEKNSHGYRLGEVFSE